MKLLVVEDEARIASFLRKGLRTQGYAVETVASGGEALARASVEAFDLVILDLRLPDVDGLHVLRELRSRRPSLPVIILTARRDVDDRVQGLDLGADDYMTKPFALDELFARVRARLRPQADQDPNVLEVGDVRLDLRERRARLGDREVTLTDREAAVLETFLRHEGEVLSREQLLSRVWGYHFDPGSNLVDVYVGYLRRKLGDDRLQTIRGVGYRFHASALQKPE